MQKVTNLDIGPLEPERLNLGKCEIHISLQIKFHDIFEEYLPK